MSEFSSLMRATGRACSFIATVTILFAATLVQAGETTNKIGITMVDIPAGSFLMGVSGDSGRNKEEDTILPQLFQSSSSSDPCNYTDDFVLEMETPRHSVNVKAFQIAKAEVTLGQFKQFITATGNEALMSAEFISHNAYGDDKPVVMVSWNDAQAFIGWLNKTDGGGYRLPTEAEWEYACRAGSYQFFCGSNSANGLIWRGGDSTLPQEPPEPAVGGKLVNAFGLYDMSGSAKEWVQDCWHEDYNGAPDDGSAWISGDCEGRVARGGAFRNCIKSLRATARSHYVPDERESMFGLRIARSR